MVDNAGDVVTENAGEGTDTIQASVNYTLAANSSVEFLRANAGATGLTLTGNNLANTVAGNVGNDTLNGGAGNDTLNGNGGNDIFRFLAGFGADTVADFDSNPLGGQDLLDISSLGITAATFNANVLISAGANPLVTIGGNTIRLNGAAAGSVDRFDFILA
jgi:Ca2+-binding RTX toxin-like protein